MAESAASAKQEDVLAAFHGQIEPVRLPLAYRFGILLVAVVMVLLPLIYVALIGLVGYGVYYHMTHNVWLLGSGRGRGKLMVVLIYIAPLVVGGILILFLLKPLFSRAPTRRKPQSLKRDQEPLLFAFVDRVCEAVHAPKPRRIDIDSQVNASAGFRRGLWSMFGRDLVLTVGMPLVAGFNMRQFAGVLAHEFGHFSQGAGMRLTYLIRMISFWFTRVVYERDAWDEQLISWAHGTDLRIGWVLHLARFFVWLTRRILWVLMMVGHGVSGFMLRQMEFDADRHEARLAGSDTFETTARRLVELNVANQGAQSDLSSFYREGRLGDDLPKLILHNVSQFTPEVYAKLAQMTEESKTGWLDTHPCDKDRIASAQRENAPGIFRLDRPASELFRDFDATSKAATWEFYQEIFEDRLRPEEIHPIDELLVRQQQETEALKALGRFFQDTYSPVRPLRLPGQANGNGAAAAAPGFLTIPQELAAATAWVGNSRQAMLAGLPSYRDAYDRFVKAEVEQEAALEPELAPWEEQAGERLFAALRLMDHPDLAGLLPDAPRWREDRERLLRTLETLDRQMERYRKLYFTHAVLTHLLERISAGERDDGLIAATRQQMEESTQVIGELRGALADCDYPFDHAKGQISIAEYALPELPDPESPGEIHGAGERLRDSVGHLRARTLGRLCSVAEQVEMALGLPPLPEPKSE
ncbi:MAG: M48 family metallopeptidase [Planctomycetes bacterium]|nr:M48 family metallopeptidase [Planctomycetota bacterium]